MDNQIVVRPAELTSMMSEITILRARIAELEGWVKMAYFEGHADAGCGCEAQYGWKTSEARGAITNQTPADSELEKVVSGEPTHCEVCGRMIPYGRQCEACRKSD